MQDILTPYFEGKAITPGRDFTAAVTPAKSDLNPIQQQRDPYEGLNKAEIIRQQQMC